MRLWDNNVLYVTPSRIGPDAKVLVDMPVGASVFFPDMDKNRVNGFKSSAMHYAARRRTPIKLSLRFREEDGVRGYRVWKLPPPATLSKRTD